jgi:carbonic anhydrase/acetyltransferase-like protein (isoleucine patch superfamily)
MFSSLVAIGATLAGDISKNLANSKQVANVEGDKVLPKEASASVVVHHVGSEAPIVMGRSVSLHHKTKLHHVKVKPLDSNENLTSADGSQ